MKTSKKINFKKLSIYIITYLLFIFLNFKFNNLSVLAIPCPPPTAGMCIDEASCRARGDEGYYRDDSYSCNPPFVCCVKFPSGSDDTSAKGLSKPIESPTGIIPYEFETGIPGIVGPKQSLQKMTLAEFVKLLIRYVFRISGILAFIMIVWGGIEYMISGGDTKRQKSAQEKITGAIIGLILLFGFWLILNTINPDILKVPSMNPPSEGNNGDGRNNNNGQNKGNNGDGRDNNNGQNISEASKIASNLLRQSNITWYPGADKDLQDVKNGVPIQVKNNDPNWNRGKGNGSYNCEDKVKDFAKTINTNLLKAISGITSLKIWREHCSSQYEVGPFISNHNYCISPTSSHKDGKAVDISLLGDKKDTKDCTRSLLIELCKHVSDIEEKVKNCDPSQFICTTTINGVTIGIVNETCYDESHIHIQVTP
jgi:hypothetical protein